MFNYGHVYHYLVESISNLFVSQSDDDEAEGIDCQDTVTAKPLKKGRGLVKSGFVENIQDNNIGDLYFLRGHVHHSMKNDLPLTVNVSVSDVSGYIKTASCNCKASSINRCAHVTALLLHLSDYVSANGFIVQEPSTSQPCEWNKGKKRQKTPKALHEASYKSSKRKTPSDLYNWDPRLEKYRNKVDDKLVSGFVRDLQAYSAENHQLSMWETLLNVRYTDFQLDNEDVYYSKLVQDFELSLLTDIKKMLPNECTATQIPNTEQQRNSPAWHESRWCRITASICKTVILMGEKLGDNSKLTYYNYLKDKFWFPEYVCTLDMQYGITEEPKAVSMYSKLMNVDVVESGIWVNVKYPHLGASPDGLIYDQETNKLNGIIEVKCLKVLKNQTISDLITGNLTDTLKRQCFTIVDRKLVLKKSHAYYYQVQLQLLISDAEYCDFVLHSGVGEPHVERILSDVMIQTKIINNTKTFWAHVLIPEYFIMRVPRGLLPAIIREGCLHIFSYLKMNLKKLLLL